MAHTMTIAALDAAALRRRAILSCIVGNLFELFDFGVYGYFAAAIGHAIFPTANPINSILSSFATYGVGFLMRPVGAMVIGSYGDRYGRKSALVLTVTMMATATGLTGLVPSYATIGLFAPALLVLCRLMQGFSTGGEWGGAASFMVEYAPPGCRAFFGSLQQVSTGLGQLSSITAAFVLNSTLAPADLTSWGWRVLCEMFPTQIRYTALSVGYNAAVMIFGGFAPFIATFLVKITGQTIAPTYYVMACALTSLLVILRVPDRTKAVLM